MQSRTSFLIAAFVVMSLEFTVVAQSKHWSEIKGKPLVKFDWNCASPSAYPQTKLNRVVKAALRRHAVGGKTWADRALVFDLNADRKPEYFIPLICGATGNCTWGVFALGPPRLLGIVGGQYVYVHKRAGRWPHLISYTHMSASEGILATYRFRKTQYRWSGDEYPTDVRGGIFGNKVPKFLDKARAACESLGG